MIIWALFDSGNGCYAQGVKELNEGGQNIAIYSVGLDVENKNSHFIHLNLADYSYLFGNNKTCESWSVASAMDSGNACWKREQTNDCLFNPQTPLSPFTVRDYADYEKYQYKAENQLVKRINGELCTYNLVQIIRRYRPRYYIIENPASSKIWDYIDRVLGFKIPYDNLAHYNQYDNYPVQKPTKFKSNIELKLKIGNKLSSVDFKQIRRYNTRSNIPVSLVKSIFEQVLEKERD